MSALEPPDNDCASAVRTLPAIASGLSEATAPVAVSINAANAIVAESTNALISPMNVPFPDGGPWWERAFVQ